MESNETPDWPVKISEESSPKIGECSAGKDQSASVARQILQATLSVHGVYSVLNFSVGLLHPPTRRCDQM